MALPSEGEIDTEHVRDCIKEDYDIAETILVPETEGKTGRQTKEKTQRHKSPHRSEKSKETLAPVDPNDPKEIVKKYWHGSFTESRGRKVAQTRSKIRQQMLLTEELQRLENETLQLQWGEIISELSGTVRMNASDLHARSLAGVQTLNS